jgi:uncharacterized protein YigE (DUF2233 family)
LTWKIVLPGLELAQVPVPDDAIPPPTAYDGKNSRELSESAELPAGAMPEPQATRQPEPMPKRRAESIYMLVRIDPARYKFTLHMASEDPPARSLVQWAARHELCAAINAGMYLPDRTTSTGYMRGANHINNKRIGGKLGAFFVANPRSDLPQKEQLDLPPVDIIERGDPEWEDRLARYSLVVQNYRLISREGRILWPEGGAEHSIAAIARDREGRIIFILCDRPLSPTRFATYLRRLPLSLGTVMYVEGGGQAGIVLRERTTYTVWMGRQSILQIMGHPDAPLPNIIGVQSISAGK